MGQVRELRYPILYVKIYVVYVCMQVYDITLLPTRHLAGSHGELK
jgi:hypothetical protein